MKLKKLRTKQGEVKGDMTPMIDVVFLLLIFFMVATTFVEESHLFKIKLPKADKPKLLKPEDVVTVEISRNDEFIVEGKAVKRSDVLEGIRKGLPAPDGAKRPIVIRADREADYKNIIFILDCAKALDASEISFAVRREN